MLSVKPELEQAFNQLCSDVVLHIRVIIAVHFEEIADISGIAVKDCLLFLIIQTLFCKVVV